jgi:hypothetical protein
MSLLDRDLKNMIYLTLYQSQICHNNTQYLPYSLSISYNDSPAKVINQIKTKKHIFNEKILNFQISNSKRKDNHIISLCAYTKSMLVLKNIFAKVKIPFNLKKCNTNQKQWYFLKDNDDEIVLKILISILSEVYLNQNNSMNSLNRKENKSSDFLGIKSPHNNSCFNLNVNTFNLNKYPFSNRSMSNLKVEPSLLYSIKQSNQLLSILENENDNNLSLTENHENLNYNLNNWNISEISIDEINNKISSKVDSILDLQNNIEKNSEFLRNLDLNYKKKKHLILKEKEKLKDNVKKFQKLKKIYESKYINVNEYVLDLKKSIYRNEIINEIDNYNKNIFSNLNYILSSINQIPNYENYLKNEKKESLNIKLKNDDSNLNTNANSNYNSTSSKKTTVNQNSNKVNVSINLNLNYNSSTNNENSSNKKNQIDNLLSKNSNSVNLLIYGNELNKEKMFRKHHSPSNILHPKKIIKNYQNNIVKGRNKNEKDIHSPKNNIRDKNKNTLKKEFVEFDNIKVITIKHSKSKSNVLNNERKKYIFSNNKKSNKFLNSNHLSKSNSNTINSANRKLYNKKTMKTPSSKFSLINDLNSNNNNKSNNQFINSTNQNSINQNVTIMNNKINKII